MPKFEFFGMILTFRLMQCGLPLPRSLHGAYGDAASYRWPTARRVINDQYSAACPGLFGTTCYTNFIYGRAGVGSFEVRIAGQWEDLTHKSTMFREALRSLVRGQDVFEYATAYFNPSLPTCMGSFNIGVAPNDSCELGCRQLNYLVEGPLPYLNCTAVSKTSSLPCDGWCS